MLLIVGIGGGYYWYTQNGLPVEFDFLPTLTPTPQAVQEGTATPKSTPSPAIATSTPYPCADPTPTPHALGTMPTPTPPAASVPSAMSTPAWEAPEPLSDEWRERASGRSRAEVDAILAESLAVFDTGLDDLGSLSAVDACRRVAVFETRLETAEFLVGAHGLEREPVPGQGAAALSWTIWLRHQRGLFVEAVQNHAPVAQCRSILAPPTPTPNATPAPPAAPPTLGSPTSTPLPPCPTATPTPTATAMPTPTITPTPSPTPTPLPPPDQWHLQHKAYMLELINQARAQAGVPEVLLGDNIAAQLHAEDSLANCVSGHWGVDGLKPYMRYSLAGGYQYDAENGLGLDYCIKPSDGYRALGSIESEIQEAMDSWMGSSGHRRNILDPWHKKVNIGLAWDRYNFMAYQHFESDFVRYDRLPQIRNGTLSLSGRAINELRFSNKEELGLQLFYDPPPHTLTRGQVSRTYCYTIGISHPIAAFLYPLSWGEWTQDSYTSYSYDNCPDPYDISSDAPAPRSANEALHFHYEAVNQPLVPLPPMTVPWITASEWTASGAAFSIVADIRGLLSEYGPGVYTILLWGEIGGEDVPVSQYSIFHQVEPPSTYDPSRWE